VDASLRDQVPRTVHIGADDLGDLRVRIVEHLTQQERGPLPRRQALQQHQERQRQRVGDLGMLGR
jgi:hypothetical protein